MGELILLPNQKRYEDFKYSVREVHILDRDGIDRIYPSIVETPESFSVDGFFDDYSKQEYEYLERLTRALLQYRNKISP